MADHSIQEERSLHRPGRIGCVERSGRHIGFLRAFRIEYIMTIDKRHAVAYMANNGPAGVGKNPDPGHDRGRRSPGSDTVEIVVERLDASPEVVCESETLLSDTERHRAARFVFDRDRNRFVLARARLRQLLALRLGTEPGSVELTQDVHGKPALAQCLSDSGLRFNLSHSNDVAVFAFASGCEVGIDVEAVRVMDDADAIAARFFSVAENKAYLELDPGDRVPGFFNCWTRKEAFVKAIGEGLSYRLDRFDVSLAPGEPARILRVDDKPGDACGWHLDAFNPIPGYVAAVVTELRSEGRLRDVAARARSRTRRA
jgi:4'-phosphopantetheinyl transferase